MEREFSIEDDFFWECRIGPVLEGLLFGQQPRRMRYWFKNVTSRILSIYHENLIFYCCFPSTQDVIENTALMEPCMDEDSPTVCINAPRFRQMHDRFVAVDLASSKDLFETGLTIHFAAACEFLARGILGDRKKKLNTRTADRIFSGICENVIEPLLEQKKPISVGFRKMYEMWLSFGPNHPTWRQYLMSSS